MTGLSIDQHRTGSVVVLELRGRLIFDEQGDVLLRQEVAGAVADGERFILLDLSGVHQMDSGGVGTLVAVYLHSLKRGAKLKLLSPSERVTRVLHMTHLETAFEVYSSESDAVGSFGVKA
jgi:anti-sigma B factor antagonist